MACDITITFEVKVKVKVKVALMRHICARVTAADGGIYMDALALKYHQLSFFSTCFNNGMPAACIDCLLHRAGRHLAAMFCTQRDRNISYSARLLPVCFMQKRCAKLADVSHILIQCYQLSRQIIRCRGFDYWMSLMFVCALSTTPFVSGQNDFPERICLIKAVAPSDFFVFGALYKYTILLLLILLLLLLLLCTADVCVRVCQWRHFSK